MIIEPQQENNENFVPPFFNAPAADDSLGSLKYQLTNDVIIEDLIRNWRQQIRSVDKHGRTIWVQKPGTRPLINELGIANVEIILKSHLTKIVALSDLEDDTIRQLENFLREDLAQDFFYNWEKYELEPGGAHILIQVAANVVYCTLRKGYKGNYMRLLRSTHSSQEVQHGGITKQGASGGDERGNPFSSMLFKNRR